MSKQKSGRRRRKDEQPPKTPAQIELKRAKDAEHKRKACWADPEKARAQERAMYQRSSERRRAQRRARYWKNPEKERARARAYAKAHPECNRRAVKKWRDAHPDIIVVWGKTKTAIRRGEIKLPPICQAAGCERREGLHLHHARYTAKPRDVITLCRHHHEHVHHQGPLKLKEGSSRRWARAPQEAKAAHVN